MTNVIAKLIAENNVNVAEEGVAFVFNDAIITIAYDEEKKQINADLTTVDRVINYPVQSIENLIEEDENIVNNWGK